MLFRPLRSTSVHATHSVLLARATHPRTIPALHSPKHVRHYDIASLDDKTNPIDPKDAPAIAKKLTDQKHPDIGSITNIPIAAGPPPLSSYKLTFGKHRGLTLDQVPDEYLARYLIPRSTNGHYCAPCLLLHAAVLDWMERHPGVKAQMGRGKLKPLDRVREEPPEKKGRGRPKKSEPKRLP